jgi:hypothetical protein
MTHLLRKLLDDEGQDIAEYAVMLARDSGVGGWYDSPGWKQCEQRVFVRSEFNSVNPARPGIRHTLDL